MAEIKKQLKESSENEEFTRFQYEEIASANLQDGLQEELEAEAKTLTHAEDIKSSLFSADNLLNGEETGAVQQLRSATDNLANITAVFPKANELNTRLDTVYIEIKDIA